MFEVTVLQNLLYKFSISPYNNLHTAYPNV